MTTPPLSHTSKTVRVMVTGSREWTSASIIRSAFAELEPDHAVIVHGGAKGADQLAARVAEQFGYDVEEHPADWEAHGKRAGIIRNLDMLASGIDRVMAFRVGMSRGTTHAIEAAKAQGLPVKVWQVNGDYTKVATDSWPRRVPDPLPFV